jgi:NAD(P)-dependent dehydrogenase (short-subunit alcohol dehydrogenase family)
MSDPASRAKVLTISLEVRTALVTGGGTGIGKACAGAMARLGAIVTISGPEARSQSGPSERGSGRLGPGTVPRRDGAGFWKRLRS